MKTLLQFIRPSDAIIPGAVPFALGPIRFLAWVLTLTSLLGGASCCNAAVRCELFEAGRTFHGGGGGLVLGDFNRDGIIDVVAGGHAYLGNGDGTFRFQTNAGPVFFAGIVAVDMDGDGILDLVSG